MRETDLTVRFVTECISSPFQTPKMPYRSFLQSLVASVSTIGTRSDFESGSSTFSRIGSCSLSWMIFGVSMTPRPLSPVSLEPCPPVDRNRSNPYLFAGEGRNGTTRWRRWIRWPRATAPTLEETGKSPAVRLFRERALSVAPDFQLTEGNCHAVLAICRKLAGLPLAIELAAARSDLLSPAAMANRLERRLPNSRRGSPDQLEQQQTMRAAVAWSYDLLTPDEQSILRNTSLLSSWFNMSDAMAHTGSGEDSNRQPSADLLSSLARKSLLELSAIDGDLRYRLPEVVRECARELLSASDEEPQARRRP